ncbi:hypothetical protein L5M18_22815 [Shewanella sp. SM20]|uniref:hypothetical protein n=1 Tax=Shewanella sp. SM20 TaxID=2912792 RepID=UPI0021D951FE|nr:hypothetical protein [Shewanella sp. SM20]MCU8094333.1 hypothetical protein [Shewanella sp. SM20]
MSQSIAEILKCTVNHSLSSIRTEFSDLDESSKRHVVVAAVLEIYKAEALGGAGMNSFHNNLSEFSEHVAQILDVLNTES